MLLQAQRDTAPELRYRRELYSRGFRYRVDHRIAPLRRRADIAFPGRKVVVFIDGCFWHGCPEHGTIPKSNREWWIEKLRGNAQRDRETDALLSADGWRVVRIWEHEPVAEGLRRILEALEPASESTARGASR